MSTYSIEKVTAIISVKNIFFFSHFKLIVDYLYTVKKHFQDLLSQHIFFCQINFIIIYLVEITYHFEFLMIKLISFIVLTHFFQFNQSIQST